MNVLSTMRKSTAISIFGAAILVASCGGGTGGTTGGSGSAAAASFNLVTPGTLTVATWGSSPPAITINGNSISGLDGLLINELAKEYQLKVKVFSTDFAGTVLAVQQAKADFGTYFYYTAQRSKTIFYPKPFIADYAVIVSKDPFKYTGPASLKGQKLGEIAGSLYTPILQNAYPGQVSVFPDHATVAEALINGQVTAILEANSFIGTPAVAHRTDVHISPVKSGDIPGLPDSEIVNPSYNPMPCNHKALADAMDVALTKIMATSEWKSQMTAGQVVNPPGFTFTRPTEGC